MDDTENDYPWRYDPIPRRDVQLPPREPEATRIAELERERDALKAAKWDVKHTDTMNEIVQMGMARDEATARADHLAALLKEARGGLEWIAAAHLGTWDRQGHMDCVLRARATLARMKEETE